MRPNTYQPYTSYLVVMASATRERDGSEGVVFIREDDGSVTAEDLETGLARGGDTRAEALAQLAEVLALHEGGGESIEDPAAFLREELDLGPDEVDEDRELPDFLR
jgi:predicted RNase H-like HicB family nuclease